MSACWRVTVAIVWAIGVAAGLQAEDWPCWRGPRHDGVSLEKGWSTAWPEEGPKKLWKASVGIGFSSMAVAQGRLFTMGNRDDAADTVYALDAVTGKELWKYSYPCTLDPQYYEGGPGATPTVDGANVYTLSKRGHFFCFEAATGKVIWKKNLLQDFGVEKPRWGFAASPLIEGRLVILNAGGTGAGFDKASGELVWMGDRHAGAYATPVPFEAQGRRSVLILSRKNLVAVQTSDGAVEWEYPWVTKWDINIATPVLVDGRAFVSSFDRGCALIELSPGPKAVWQNKNMGNHFNSCVLVGGFLYGVNGNSDEPARDFRCLDAATGAVQWREEGFGLGSVFAADGKLVVLSDHGELVVAEANPKKFRALARTQALGGKCWIVPVLANGLIYCRNAQGDLVCLDVR